MFCTVRSKKRPLGDTCFIDIPCCTGLMLCPPVYHTNLQVLRFLALQVSVDTIDCSFEIRTHHRMIFERMPFVSHIFIYPGEVPSLYFHNCWRKTFYFAVQKYRSPIVIFCNGEYNYMNKYYYSNTLYSTARNTNIICNLAL